MGAQRMSLLPKTIKIGAQDWALLERTSAEDGMLNDGTFGYTLQTSNLIVVDKNCPPSRKRQTVFHELFHAVRFSSGNSGIKPNLEDVLPSDVIITWEHYFIGIYEDALLAVLRDNPKLAEYLLAKDTTK
jgi:hypothetical protein